MKKEQFWQSSNKLLSIFITLIFLLHFSLLADEYVVNTTLDPQVNSDGTLNSVGNENKISLRSAILKANRSGAVNSIVGQANIIKFDPAIFSNSQTIALNTELPMIFSNLTIDASGLGLNTPLVIDGSNQAEVRRGLFVSGLPYHTKTKFDPNGPPQSIMVKLSNITFQNLTAKGGDSDLGGGGMGAGGAIFANHGVNLTLENISFKNNQAIGGNGIFRGNSIPNNSQASYGLGSGGLGGNANHNGGGGIGGDSDGPGGGGIGSNSLHSGGGGFGGNFKLIGGFEINGIGQVLTDQFDENNGRRGHPDECGGYYPLMYNNILGPGSGGFGGGGGVTFHSLTSYAGGKGGFGGGGGGSGGRTHLPGRRS